MATLVTRLPFSAIALTGSQFAPQFEGTIASSAALTEPMEWSVTIFSRAKQSAYRIVSNSSSLPNWVRPTVSAFVDIQNLNDNWDSYGAKPISQDLIKEALLTLVSIMRANSPAPFVVPLGDGGIQLEWHRLQQDLEIVFPFDEAPQFSYRNRATGAEVGGLANDIDALTRLIGSIV